MPLTDVELELTRRHAEVGNSLAAGWTVRLLERLDVAEKVVAFHADYHEENSCPNDWPYFAWLHSKGD